MEGARTAAEAGRRTSVRVLLARLARDAALGVGGVASVGPRPVPGRATHDGEERLEGVVCTAEPDGRYGVTLYLGAEPVRLQELAGRVRANVVAAADRAGVRHELGAVDVVVDDLAEPGTRA